MSRDFFAEWKSINPIVKKGLKLLHDRRSDSWRGEFRSEWFEAAYRENFLSGEWNYLSHLHQIALESLGWSQEIYDETNKWLGGHGHYLEYRESCRRQEFMKWLLRQDNLPGGGDNAG